MLSHIAEPSTTQQPFGWHIARYTGDKLEQQDVQYTPPEPEILKNLGHHHRVAVTNLYTADQFDDLLNVVRTLCAVAERMSQPNSENYPSPLAEGSPLLAAARRACVLRGFTEAGLSVDVAGGAA